MAKQALVIGDATLDITVRSPTLAEPGADHPADITIGPGGQGANVAVRLARLGWTVRLLTVVGTDATGRLLAGWLTDDGVQQVNGGDDTSGLVASIIGRDGERAMLSDRRGLSVDSVEHGLAQMRIAADEWIHLSAYALADPASGDALATAAAGLARSHRLSVGGGSFVADGPVPGRWRNIRPCLSVFDRREAEALAGTSGTAAVLASHLASRASATVVVTDGPDGATAGRPDGSTVAGAHEPRVQVVDATGAGDAFTAALIDRLADQPDWALSEVLGTALDAASRHGAAVASRVGAQARIPGEAWVQ